ncbi:MAG: SIS domain-containing protein [Candidatus Omnitrophica bacterium]|nr:SIS domain-containing protein [Candidatus Omnitrophota bacterium]
MKNKIKNYHKKFINLINSIEVTDRSGKALDFYQGIELACSVIRKQSRLGGKVFFIGNGGSAAIASHMAIDFWKNLKIEALSFSDSSLLTCISNDFGYDYVFAKPIEFFAGKKDILLSISSSGKSQNILKAVAAAKAKGASVITLSGFSKNNPLRLKGICNFYVPASEYGLVEVGHQYVCHYIADILLQK